MNSGAGKGRKIWNFCIHPITLCVVGIIGGVGSSWYYYEKGKSDVVAQAVEEAKRAGLAQAYKDGMAAFEANKLDLIEKRYPGAIKQARDLGFAEGREQGRADGREAARKEGYAEGENAGTIKGRDSGYADGFKKGHEEAAKQFSLQTQAEKNWQLYAIKVDGLAYSADELASNPQDKQIRELLLSEARALISAAEQLRSAYTDQAAAFNGIMLELKTALEAQNFPLLRAHARSLRSNLEIKKSLFLQANQKMISAFEALGKRERSGLILLPLPATPESRHASMGYSENPLYPAQVALP
jgi:flagellar biosynthesis/type III secretory pathway protein FliH